MRPEMPPAAHRQLTDKVLIQVSNLIQTQHPVSVWSISGHARGVTIYEPVPCGMNVSWAV